jgi:hypothetical protein
MPRVLMDSQLAFAYEKMNAPRVAFIDESFQLNTKRHLPFYSMTATLVGSEPSIMSALRSDVHRIVGDDYHATISAQSLDPVPIDDLLEYVRESEAVTSIITIETEMVGPKYKIRAATLAQLVIKVMDDNDAPALLVADAQDAQWELGTMGLDRNDLAVVKELIQGGIIGSRTRILHSKASHENLLHLPDTVQWAVQRALRGDSKSWERIASTAAVYSVKMDAAVSLEGIAGVKQQAQAGASTQAVHLNPAARNAINDLGSRGHLDGLRRAKALPGVHFGSEQERRGALSRAQ